jgi:hypothetical protein
VRFEATRGVVQCRNGARLEIHLPPLSVPFPPRSAGEFGPMQFMERLARLSRPKYHYTSPVRS